MKLNKITKITKKTKRRLGLGHGSGRVKTAGRGTKGQKARYKIPLHFEGGALPLIKRLPFHRGKGKNKSFNKKAVPINLTELSVFKNNSVVDEKALINAKIISEREIKLKGVKILGQGKINNSLIIKVPISLQALKKIEKAGGKVEFN
jgi:large subunit ribosomal protein L15